MGKVRRFFRGKSIKKSFVVYMMSGILAALVLAMFFSMLCQWGRSVFYKKYKDRYGITEQEFQIRFDESGSKEGSITISRMAPDGILSYFTPFDRGVYEGLEFLNIVVYPLCFVSCIVVTSLLFYRRILKGPLELLDGAAARIAENDLDFRVSYRRADEMGKLCDSFERMRHALQENNEEMWRQIEERKRLNAAFSHDLRTPLTVLKGQSEMLGLYAPKMTADKVAGTAEMMRRHILRLEKYVDMMGDLQRLEDIPLERKNVELAELIGQMRMTGEAVCEEKEFVCSVPPDGKSSLNLDVSVFMRVFENLLSNALRFAHMRIEAAVEVQDGFLYLSVSDDGPGFGGKDLENATKPFYKTINGTDSAHFGMGLNICKILCEKHGGYLKLENREGAFVMAAFRIGNGAAA